MTKQAIFRTTPNTEGLLELPEGFVLDEPNLPSASQGLSELPEGFVLDKQPEELSDTDIQGLITQMRGKMPAPTKTRLTQKDYNLMIAGVPPVEEPAEKPRRQAYQTLTQAGYTDPQIKLLMDIQKAETPKMLGQTIGGTVGSIALPAILGQIPPFTALPEEAFTIPLSIALFGAGVGGAAGKGAQIGIQEKRAPTGRELLRAGGEEMAYEAGGRAIFKGLKLAFSPFIKKTVPEAAALVDDFARKSGHFTPGQIDKRWPLRMADEISRGAFISKDILKKFDENTQKRIIIYSYDIIESMGKGFSRNPTEAGEMLLDMIARPGMGAEGKGKILKAFEDLISPLYKQIDDMTKTASVSTKGLRNFADDLLAKDTKLKKLYLSPTGRSKLQKVSNLSEYVKFGDMQDLRSTFLADVRKLSRDADKADAILKRIAKLSDEAIFDPKATIALSQESKTLLKNTNALYRTSKEIMTNTFPFKLAKELAQHPESAMKIFKAGDRQGIRNIRLALTKTIKGRPNPEGKAVWNQLRQQWLSQAVEGSIKDDQISRRGFERALNKMGLPALREMFDANEISRINKITGLLDITQRTGTSGTTLFSKGIQVGGATAAYYKAREGDYIGATAFGALALSPIAYAKLAIHPVGAKLLTAGIKIPRGSERLGPLAIRMIRVLRGINAEKKKADKMTQLKLQLIRRPSGRDFGLSGRGF